MIIVDFDVIVVVDKIVLFGNGYFDMCMCNICVMGFILLFEEKVLC